jgi:hypothetical protein
VEASFNVIPAKAGIQSDGYTSWIALKSFTSCPDFAHWRHKLRYLPGIKDCHSEEANHELYCLLDSDRPTKNLLFDNARCRSNIKDFKLVILRRPARHLLFGYKIIGRRRIFPFKQQGLCFCRFKSKLIFQPA